jgi:hypothetical protein
VNRFDVSVYAIRRRAGRRRPFEVRWSGAGRSRSKSFITRRLADSYRAELVRAARTGLDFDPLTGEPAAWNTPEPSSVTWYQQATAYAAMKWPSLAAHTVRRLIAERAGYRCAKPDCRRQTLGPGAGPRERSPASESPATSTQQPLTARAAQVAWP